MILDYRIYCTIYVGLVLAWVATFFLLARARPGAPDFDEKMHVANKHMGIVLAIAALIAALNLLDWLWS